MATTHTPMKWGVDAQLVDEDGAPYDLSARGTVVLWALTNAAGQRVLDENDVVVTIVDAPAGRRILIPSSQTASLRAGSYHDTLRLVAGG